MALITLSGLLTDITGSIGGTTFQNTGAGLIARNKPMARKSASPSQSRARQFTGTFTQRWRDLTLVQKLAWDAFATAHTKVNRFGQSKNLSGFAWFESVNYNLTRAGLANVLLPPVYTTAPAVDVFTVTFTPTKIQVTYAVAPAPANTYSLCWASYIVGSGNTSNRSRYRYLQTLAFGGGLVNFDVTSSWQTVYGKTWAGQPAGTKCTIIIGVNYIDTRSGIAGAILFASGEFTF
jgi:hypothetical protein